MSDLDIQTTILISSVIAELGYSPTVEQVAIRLAEDYPGQADDVTLSEIKELMM